MHAITNENLSLAWNEALQHLVENDGKCVHLAVAITRPLDPEVDAVRDTLDQFIAERRGAGSKQWPISTVANTMFPGAFYRPSRENPRERLYELHAKAQRMQQRMADSESYFNRLVAYPGADGKPFNQLEYIVQRLIKQRQPRKGGRGGPLSSAYELGLSVPDGGDLRVQAPGQDRNIMSFPCLSQISFTLEGEKLNLAALYRNQYFITRAYGNYVGLARIGNFIASEVDVQLGEILCLATHADAEFSDLTKGRVKQLANSLRAALTPIESVSA
jgi:hypothetical protein